MEEWKQKIGEAALKSGVIDDPAWLEKLDESIPVWEMLQRLLELKEKLEPKYHSYD